MKHFIIALGLLLLAMPAWGASQWAPCGLTSVALAAASNTSSANGKIVPGESECFYFNVDEDSRLFFVTHVALIMIYPDMAGAGVESAAVDVVKCVPGTTTYSANLCTSILDAALDGTPGADGTQVASVRVPTGLYQIRNSVTANTEEAVVAVTGE